MSIDRSTMFKSVKPNKKIRLSKESILQKVQDEYKNDLSKAAKGLNIPYKTLWRWVKGYNDKYNSNVRRFVITYAQNNTEIHEGFFRALQVYMTENNDTELICYRGYYDPKHGQNKLAEEDVWYDARIRPYLMDSERKLNEKVMIYPAKTIPTAVTPLSGYEAHTDSLSGIFPHPKVQLKTVPTPGHELPKILTTTGAITLKNYSNSKAGEKGKKHHIIGAVVVEVVNNKVFHIRHIAAEKDTGNFYDIAGNSLKYYQNDGVTSAKTSTASLFCGDSHSPWVSEKVLKAQEKLIKVIKPKNIFLNDVTDFWSQNHHEVNNRFLNAAKATEGMLCVKKEVEKVSELIKHYLNVSKATVHIVRSNHDEAMERWLNEANPNNIGINSEYYHYLAYKKHQSKKRVANGFTFHNSLEFAVSEYIGRPKNLRWLKVDEPCIIADIDHSNHGHYGPNGARGSVRSFSKIGVKTNTGHGHSPEIIDGAYRAGINCQRMAYAKGPSSWLETDIITYENGKRTLINYINGSYCLN